MIDLSWLPGVVLGGGALGHTVWLRQHWRSRVTEFAADTDRLGRDLAAARQTMDWQQQDIRIEAARRMRAQQAHALMLWPPPWSGTRPMTQVEHLVEAGQTWLGEPLDPEEQQAKMFADTQALLDSYQPPQED